MSAGVSTSGINWIALALIDDTGKIIADAKNGLSESGVVLLDGDGEGATTANITNIEEAQNMINKALETLVIASVDPICTIDMNRVVIVYDADKSAQNDSEGG